MNALPQIQSLPIANNDLVQARRVLELEIAGLQRLADTLDGRFSQAIELIDRTKKNERGRLIVAGIGKSGHIAHKMAATFSSTGTPCYYIHPGEASHGDLGAITPFDCVILISLSGESLELNDLIAYTRRFGIPLIAITGNENSALGTHADLTLCLPKTPEACPNGLAPTTSTTMTLALGDALAVALMHRIGFKATDFSAFHPGGKLGRKLVKVSNLMIGIADLPLVTPDTKMDRGLIVMSEKNLGSLIVIDRPNNALRGIITDGDLKRHMRPDLLSQSVSTIMSTEPRTVAPDLLAAEALDIMLNRFKTPLTSLVVEDKGCVVGLIRVQECLRAGVM